jgi:hypothetical protein
MIMHPSSQTLNLQERIKRLAERVRAEAMALPEGEERTELLMKAQAMTGTVSEFAAICDRAGDRAAAQ